MTGTRSRPRGVHLVGSAPFATSREFFEAVGRDLGSHVSRVPDGEPGERATWVTWQFPFLARSPLLELAPARIGYDGRGELRLKDGADASRVQFDDLGYAAEAIKSYGAFDQVKQAGVLPPHVRFQVSLPTPLNVLVGGFVDVDSRGPLEPAYTEALQDEIGRICAAIPHHELAIQWDLCLETLLWEENFDDFLSSEWYKEAARDCYWGGHEGMVERAAAMLDGVPEDVETGVHFCYGDFMSRHDYEPKDLGHVTELSLALLDVVRRPIAFMHMPVPIDRSDEQYFAPLRELELSDATELFLGLVHLGDGEAGAAARIAAAQSAVESFGVATECGWGRRAVGEISVLARLHAAVADPVN